MNYTKTLFLFALLVATTMTACSGLGDVCKTNCGNGGGGGGGGGTDATLSVTLQAAPLTPPPNVNILSYVLTLGGATLTPASGNPTNIPASYTLDLTRLQSDSVLLGTVTVPAGTYTSLSLLISADVTYCNVVAGVPGCSAGSVAQVSAAGTSSVITFPNGGLVLSSSQDAGVSAVFAMQPTITLTNGTLSINLAPTTTGTNNLVLSTITLGPSHPSSLTSTQLDYLEDVTGNVSSVNGNVVTIQTATYGNLAATATSNTFYSPNCTTLNLGLTIACAQVNQVASINAILNADGTITLTSYDPISAASATNNDWIEGVVAYTPSSTTQFVIVANDADISSTSPLLPKPPPIGSLITVDVAGNAVYGVDTQGLMVPADYTNFGGAPLLPGQAVAVHVTSFGLTGGVVGGILVNTDAVELRFSRVAGTASGSGTTTSFSLSSNSLPPYFGFTTANQLVELTSGTPPSTNVTNYDGVTSPTSIVSGDTYSIRALYFGQFDAYPFVAAKVRQNP